jgi:hypothetical protein
LDLGGQIYGVIYLGWKVFSTPLMDE